MGVVTEVRKRLEDVIKGVESLNDVAVKTVKTWLYGHNLGVMKVGIPANEEAAFRNTADTWVEAFTPGVKLQGATWYPLRVDYVPIVLVRDQVTGQFSSTVQSRLAEQNRINVMYAKPFSGWQRKQHHCSKVIKVATREEQEK